MDKKKRIIESAITLFATNGYENTSVAAICEHSNVSKGLVFHHFKNKDGLLREVFMRMAEIGDCVEKIKKNKTQKID